VALWTLVVIGVAEGVVAIALKDNDFLWHRHHGEAFLAGDSGKDHYLPARAVFDVPLALGPYRLTRAVAYCVGLLLLLGCYLLWERMAARSVPAAPAVVRAAGFLSVFLLLPYLLRDLDECGLQLQLLFFMTIGGYALFLGRPVLSGFALAAAASYKVTPLLCLPFLIWKRQWRAAACMAGFLLVWATLPAMYSGWENNLQAHERWWAELRRISAAHQAYPSLLDREPPKPENLSLYAAITRYLQSYPAGHPLHLNHPWFRQFGALPPMTAYYALYGILAGLGLWYAWKARRRWEDAEASSAMPAEWATLCALSALLSPLCWKQHLIIALPCAYLVLRDMLVSPSPGRLRIAVMVLIAAVVYLGRRFVLGSELSVLVMSYKIDTLAVVALLLGALSLASRRVVTETKPLTAASGTLTRAA
jgi:hypothetical protein